MVSFVQKELIGGGKKLLQDNHNCADFVSQFISFLLVHREEQCFQGALPKLLA